MSGTVVPPSNATQLPPFLKVDSIILPIQQVTKDIDNLIGHLRRTTDIAYCLFGLEL
jgi:hypothetical protein